MTLPHDQNRHTQPHLPRPVFGNWDVIAEGWYIAVRSADLPRGAVRPFELNGQRLVVFRGADGVARALDAFCPHMGTDLSTGKVVGDTLRCFFHHWRFDGEGRCVHIPARPGAEPPRNARVPAYATAEGYGWVWVWPDAVAAHPLPSFEGLEGAELLTWDGTPVERGCHHHVCMINGIDAQHLATVHDIHVQMRLSFTEHADGHVADFVLEGPVPDSRWGRLLRRLIGPVYRYGMRYSDACIGLLTTVKGLRLGGTGPRLPELHMIYACLPLARGRIRIQPIFVARRRPGPLGALWTRILLLATVFGYRLLQHEDGNVYDHIRFDPHALLPIDAPVARFVAWVDRLKPSRWSAAAPPAAESAREVS